MGGSPGNDGELRVTRRLRAVQREMEASLHQMSESLTEKKYSMKLSFKRQPKKKMTLPSVDKVPP